MKKRIGYFLMGVLFASMLIFMITTFTPLDWLGLITAIILSFGIGALFLWLFN